MAEHATSSELIGRQPPLVGQAPPKAFQEGRIKSDGIKGADMSTYWWL